MRRKPPHPELNLPGPHARTDVMPQRLPKPTFPDRRFRFAELIAFLTVFSACAGTGPSLLPASLPATSNEVHLSNMRAVSSISLDSQVSWSTDGTWLALQSASSPDGCPQVFRMRPDGSDRLRVSNGQGRATDPGFFPDGHRFFYSTTSPSGPECIPLPFSNRTVLFSSQLDGTDPLELEPGAPRSFNGQTRICHDGTAVFTSDRDGDLDLYTAHLDPLGSLSEIHRITQSVGYDGDAAFSPDCRQLVWRASHLTDPEQIARYRELLKRHDFESPRSGPTEIWTARVDGSHARQLTDLRTRSDTPIFTRDGGGILFASEVPAAPHLSSLYLIHPDGTHLERDRRAHV